MAKYTRLQVAQTMIDIGLVPLFYHDDIDISKRVLKANRFENLVTPLSSFNIDFDNRAATISAMLMGKMSSTIKDDNKNGDDVGDDTVEKKETESILER